MTNEEFIKSVSLEGEIWKDVVGYEGKYMVSSFGRVLSCLRKVTGRWGKPRTQYPRLIKLKPNKHGYVRISLHDTDHNSNKNQDIYISVHKMVLMAFCENPLNLPSIDHINGIKTDNRIENLRWCTCKENSNNPITKAFMSNAAKKRCSEHRTRRKAIVGISIQDPSIVKHYMYMSHAERDGFNASVISKCCSGKLKHHKGYKWMYLSDYENLINKSKNS
jgi:hypothetical protein